MIYYFLIACVHGLQYSILLYHEILLNTLIVRLSLSFPIVSVSRTNVLLTGLFGHLVITNSILLHLGLVRAVRRAPPNN